MVTTLPSFFGHRFRSPEQLSELLAHKAEVRAKVAKGGKISVQWVVGIILAVALALFVVMALLVALDRDHNKTQVQICVEQDAIAMVAEKYSTFTEKQKEQLIANMYHEEMVRRGHLGWAGKRPSKMFPYSWVGLF